jgi:hypothetical protein
MFSVDGVMGVQAFYDVKAWNDALIGQSILRQFLRVIVAK